MAGVSGVAGSGREDAISRAKVRESYEHAVHLVVKVGSDYNFAMLPYYEGRRDALRELLEPEEAESDA